MGWHRSAHVLGRPLSARKATALPITSVVVSPSTLYLVISGQQTFAATAYNSIGGIVAATFTWSALHGTFSGSTYTAPGTAQADTVTATAVGTAVSGTASVTVAVVAAVTVSPATATVAASAQQQFAATATDAGSHTLAGTTFTWAVNTAIPVSDSVATSETITGSTSGGAIFGPDTFTSATTVALTTYNSQYVQEYSQAGDSHQLVGGNNYLSQKVTSGGYVVSCWEGAGYPTTDQKVVIDVYSGGASRQVGVVLRWTSNSACYVLVARGGAAFTVQRAIAGTAVKTFSTLLPTATWTTCTISITGSTISVQVGANAAETFTDTTYTSGKVGLVTNANTSPYDAYLDNFTLYT